MKYDNIIDATHAWVNEFNSFPTDMILTLMQANIEAWEEITPPVAGKHIWHNKEQKSGKITTVTVHKDGKRFYKIELENGNTVLSDGNDFIVEEETGLPIWGTMWSFGSMFDKDWIHKTENQYKMAKCGFRIYRHEDWGYFFGIDGAGYDFYETHWIPLYKARGLQWHKAE